MRLALRSREASSRLLSMLLRRFVYRMVDFQDGGFLCAIGPAGGKQEKVFDSVFYVFYVES